MCGQRDRRRASMGIYIGNERSQVRLTLREIGFNFESLLSLEKLHVHELISAIHYKTCLGIRD